MAFKPQSANRTGGNFDESRNYPAPKDGSRPARVSLIVDLGTQEREPIYKIGDKIVTEDTEGAVATPQKACQQVAIFVDLTSDNVDYGGSIGTAPYRLLLNKNFKGVVQGINLTTVAPTDAKGKLIQGKPWSFHPNSVITKLSKAIEKEEILSSLDIDELLNGAFMADVEVKKTEDKNGKKGADDKVIVYTNVNYKGAAKVPVIENDAGEDVKVKVRALTLPARSIQFDTATKDDIQFIRSNLRKQIKLAKNYAGSAMEKAIQAFEAEQESKGTGNESNDDTPAEKPSEQTTKKNTPKPVSKADQGDSESPF